jgi:hypothetical protein
LDYESGADFRENGLGKTGLQDEKIEMKIPDVVGKFIHGERYLHIIRPVMHHLI